MKDKEIPSIEGVVSCVTGARAITIFNSIEYLDDISPRIYRIFFLFADFTFYAVNDHNNNEMNLQKIWYDEAEKLIFYTFSTSGRRYNLAPNTQYFHYMLRVLSDAHAELALLGK